MFAAIGSAFQNLWIYLNSEEVITAFFNNRFYTILAVIMLMRAKYAVYGNMWLCALVNLAGTFLHELMHFVVGWLLNAQPINFVVLPKKSLLGGYVMGSVSFRNISFYNAFPTAMAPLLLLPLSYYLNRYMLPYIPYSIWGYGLYILLQSIIIENAIPSGADIKIALSSWLGIALYGTLIVALLLML